MLSITNSNGIDVVLESPHPHTSHLFTQIQSSKMNEASTTNSNSTTPQEKERAGEASQDSAPPNELAEHENQLKRKKSSKHKKKKSTKKHVPRSVAEADKTKVQGEKEQKKKNEIKPKHKKGSDTKTKKKSKDSSSPPTTHPELHSSASPVTIKAQPLACVLEEEPLKPTLLEDETPLQIEKPKIEEEEMGTTTDVSSQTIMPTSENDIEQQPTELPTDGAEDCPNRWFRRQKHPKAVLSLMILFLIAVIGFIVLFFVTTRRKDE